MNASKSIVILSLSMPWFGAVIRKEEYWGMPTIASQNSGTNKDLFNIPLWCSTHVSLRRGEVEIMKHKIVGSYKNVCPIIEKVGYAEMLPHKFLTTDHKIQRTIFRDK